MISSPGAPPLRLGLVQFRPRKARMAENVDRVRERIEEAASSHDLLVFPETALSGYFLEGGVAETALDTDELARSLGAPPRDGPDVVVGFYERWRRRIYNSVAYLTPEDSRYRVVHTHRKMFLPTYGIFEEARFVEAGTDLRAFDTRFGRLGMLVCEEMWHSIPSAVLSLDGAEMIVAVSASPARGFEAGGAGRPANLERWDRLASGAASEHGVFVAVAQLVGSEGGKVFPGGSVVVGPDGEVRARGPLLEEAVVSVTIDGREIERARFDLPLLADLEQMLPHLQRSLERAGRLGGEAGDRDEESEGAAPVGVAEGGRRAAPSLRGGRGEAEAAAAPRPGDDSVLDLDLELVRRTLVGFIRDEVCRRRGFERVVIGVSGGVDSSVSLHLAVEALGAENVHGFRLPYATSSEESLEHAALVMEGLGVEGRTLEISGPIDAYVEAHEPDITPHRLGNLAARLRAVTLFDQSAKLGALPLGTGNKSERLLGYFTWHADDSPPINPLGDLLKTQVWALARHVGVPDVIVEKAPTADLVRGVNDEDELGISYPAADLILHWLLEGYRPGELVAAGFAEPEVSLVWERLNATHWKRELPTVAVLSSSAIGEFYLRPVDY